MAINLQSFGDARRDGIESRCAPGGIFCVEIGDLL